MRGKHEPQTTPRGGLEPPTFRLTAERSAIELAGIITAIILAYAKRFVKKKPASRYDSA